jgi:hypothetical protein
MRLARERPFEETSDVDGAAIERDAGGIVLERRSELNG